MTGRDQERGAAYGGATYYGRPALKAPHWDWTVSGYIFLAGLSGAAQVLAWIGGLRDPERFRGALRNARLLALAGTGAGAALLVADLKTPSRFYNMLRILRPTSPMSFGSYVLTAFGASSVLAGLGELPAARGRPAFRRVAGLAQGAAAMTGAGAATYTAALLSATSNPYWAAAPRALGAKFAASAVAIGAAALALGERIGGRSHTAGRLEAVAAVATLAGMLATRSGDRRRRAVGLEAVLSGTPEHRLLKVGDLALAGALPLAAYGLGRTIGGRAAPAAAVAGSLAVLAGGWLVRHAVLKLGKASSDRPEAHLGLARPEHLQTRR